MRKVMKSIAFLLQIDYYYTLALHIKSQNYSYLFRTATYIFLFLYFKT